MIDLLAPLKKAVDGEGLEKAGIPAAVQDINRLGFRLDRNLQTGGEFLGISPGVDTRVENNGAAIRAMGPAEDAKGNAVDDVFARGEMFERQIAQPAPAKIQRAIHLRFQVQLHKP